MKLLRLLPILFILLINSVFITEIKATSTIYSKSFSSLRAAEKFCSDGYFACGAILEFGSDYIVFYTELHRKNPEPKLPDPDPNTFFDFN